MDATGTIDRSDPTDTTSARALLGKLVADRDRLVREVAGLERAIGSVDEQLRAAVVQREAAEAGIVAAQQQAAAMMVDRLAAGDDAAADTTQSIRAARRQVEAVDDRLAALADASSELRKRHAQAGSDLRYRHMHVLAGAQAALRFAGRASLLRLGDDLVVLHNSLRDLLSTLRFALDQHILERADLPRHVDDIFSAMQEPPMAWVQRNPQSALRDLWAAALQNLQVDAATAAPE